MVQDLFLLSLDARGEGFEQNVVRAILANEALSSSGPRHWAYLDGSFGEVHGLDETEKARATHLFFTRFEGATMLARIFEIADTLDVVLFWPGAEAGEPNACVTRADRLAKIGAALRTTLTVIVARDAAHFRELFSGGGRAPAQ